MQMRGHKAIPLKVIGVSRAAIILAVLLSKKGKDILCLSYPVGKCNCSYPLILCFSILITNQIARNSSHKGDAIHPPDLTLQTVAFEILQVSTHCVTSSS